ncbi:MAG: tocopherol O-methyltransferase [Akkermansiaceae bacterium]|jgi:tocopherol O-methyltransferase|tara:strand:+ start:5752 stop:6528 length:777 start_codon:yes stop_codon:yes gene_type:complete
MPSRLYDDLDPLYREIWGTSLHHGLWDTGKESPQQARDNLINLAIDLLQPRGRIADIGCGYGTLAHRLINDFNTEIVASTASKTQANLIKPHPSLSILTGDWLAQTLTPQSLDGAIAVESLSHFLSFDSFLAHTVPALKIGAQIVIADWFSDNGKRPFLRHLAKSGDLPHWRSFASLTAKARHYGLKESNSHDLSQKTAPTWSHLLLKSLSLPVRRPNLLPVLLTQLIKRPSLLWTFPLLRLAYQTGDLQYHIVSFEK